MPGTTARTIASALGLAAFAIAIMAGLAAGNAPARILATAIAGMVCCQALGLAIGAVGQRVVTEHLASTAVRPGASPGGRPSRTSENPQVIHNG